MSYTRKCCVQPYPCPGWNCLFHTNCTEQQGLFGSQHISKIFFVSLSFSFLIFSAWIVLLTLEQESGPCMTSLDILRKNSYGHFKTEDTVLIETRRVFSWLKLVGQMWGGLILLCAPPLLSLALIWSLWGAPLVAWEALMVLHCFILHPRSAEADHSGQVGGQVQGS